MRISFYMGLFAAVFALVGMLLAIASGFTLGAVINAFLLVMWLNLLLHWWGEGR